MVAQACAVGRILTIESIGIRQDRGAFEITAPLQKLVEGEEWGTKDKKARRCEGCFRFQGMMETSPLICVGKPAGLTLKSIKAHKLIVVSTCLSRD